MKKKEIKVMSPKEDFKYKIMLQLKDSISPLHTLLCRGAGIGNTGRGSAFRGLTQIVAEDIKLMANIELVADGSNFQVNFVDYNPKKHKPNYFIGKEKVMVDTIYFEYFGFSDETFRFYLLEKSVVAEDYQFREHDKDFLPLIVYNVKKGKFEDIHTTDMSLNKMKEARSDKHITYVDYRLDAGELMVLRDFLDANHVNVKDADEIMSAFRDDYDISIESHMIHVIRELPFEY